MLPLALNLSLLCIHHLQEQKTRLMQQDEERTAKRRAKRQKQKVVSAALPAVETVLQLLSSTDTDMVVCRPNSSSPGKVPRLRAKSNPKLNLGCKSSLLRQILTDASFSRNARDTILAPASDFIELCLTQRRPTYANTNPFV